MLHVAVDRARTQPRCWGSARPCELPLSEGIVAPWRLPTSAEQDELQRTEEIFKKWSLLLHAWRSSDSSLTASIDALLRNLQQQGIVVQNIEDVNDYLESFPDMIEITDRVITAARRFLPNVKLILTLYVDPETDDQYLVIYARVTCYDESFIQQLERVGEVADSYLAYKQGWLQVTTDFAPPE